MSRGQANLPALAVALLVVTTSAGLALGFADSAFTSADRDAKERSVAAGVAAELVSADSPTNERANVLNATRVDAGTVSELVPEAVEVRVELDDELVYERGTPDDGTTIRRIVLVADRQTVTFDPDLDRPRVTLPRRTPAATIEIGAGADVETVRANDRVVLHDPSGIDGVHEVGLSRYETTTFRFEGDVETGEVTITYHPRQTTKAVLAVTVDA